MIWAMKEAVDDTHRQKWCQVTDNYRSILRYQQKRKSVILAFRGPLVAIRGESLVHSESYAPEEMRDPGKDHPRS